MPTIFEQAARKASSAIDAVHGEVFDFIAMTSPGDVDAKRIPDPTRPTFFATGAYVGPSKPTLPHARGSIQDDNAQRFVLSAPHVSVDNVRMSWTVTTGDWIVRRSTGETFEVAKPVPDGVVRTLFTLTARKRVA